MKRNFVILLTILKKTKKKISETEKNQLEVSQTEPVQNSNMETESQSQNMIEGTIS